MNDRHSLLYRLAIAAVLALAAIVAFEKALLDSLNHDEQQFIAPSVLIAREGLVPYRDFALFHMPHLTGLYAFFDLFTTRHLLAARVFSGFCGWGIIALVFGLSLRQLAARPPWVRLGLAAALACLVATSSLFLQGTGKSWNHDFSLLLVLGAFAALLVATRHPAAARWIFVAGILAGTGIGIRLTFAPIVVPFGLSILLLRDDPWRRRFSLAILFSAAVALALLPAFYFLAVEPDRFFFGNVMSQKLRLLDPTDTRAQKTVAMWRKLRFFAKEIMANDVPLFGSFLVLGGAAFAAAIRKRNSRTPAVSLLALVLPFLFFGAVSPTRYQPQHFYALVPFAALAAGCGLAGLAGRVHAASIAVVVAALASIALSAGEFRDLPKILTPAQWTGNRAHAIGQKIHAAVGSGRVLTLAPLYPLEGGARIYGELALGPFAYRLAHLVPDEKRRHYRIAAPEDLAALLQAEPPAGILLGVEEKKLEKPLQSYAEAHGFQPTLELGRMTLWTRPPAQ